MAAVHDHGVYTGDDRHYTMGNTPSTTAQCHAIPVNSPGLLEFIRKMDLQPLFQDTSYLFKEGIIWVGSLSRKINSVGRKLQQWTGPG